MIIGAHTILHSTNPAADREFLRDVLEFPSVDVGDGWLIFGLPPSEVAVHDSDSNDRHELYLMCDDVEALIATLSDREIACGPVDDQGWGLVTQITLPGGGNLHIYQPRHARPETVQLAAPAQPTAARKPRKKAAKKKLAETKKPAATKKLAKQPSKPEPKRGKKKAAKKVAKKASKRF
jgi:hypothetical protein